MKEKQQVTWKNKHITINVTLPLAAIYIAQLLQSDGFVKVMWQHCPPALLCSWQAGWVRERTTAKKKEKETNKQENSGGYWDKSGTQEGKEGGGGRRAPVALWEIGRDEGWGWRMRQVLWRKEGWERNEAVRMWQRHQRRSGSENRESETGRWIRCLWELPVKKRRSNWK